MSANNNTSSSQEPEASAEEAKITEELAKDRPTIDAAVKAFISLATARSMTESASDRVVNHATTVLGIAPEHSGTVTVPATAAPAIPETATDMDTVSDDASLKSTLQDALTVVRAIVKAVNAHKFPLQHVLATTYTTRPNLTEEKRLQYVRLSVVARLWNGLVESEQKPSRFLGRKALRYAWKDLEITLPPSNDDSGAEKRQQAMLKHFETLLFHQSSTTDDVSVNDDSALIWAPDGGQQELAKRRERRKLGAADRTKEVVEELARY